MKSLQLFKKFLCLSFAGLLVTGSAMADENEPVNSDEEVNTQTFKIYKGILDDNNLSDYSNPNMLSLKNRDHYLYELIELFNQCDEFAEKIHIQHWPEELEDTIYFYFQSVSASLQNLKGYIFNFADHLDETYLAKRRGYYNIEDDKSTDILHNIFFSFENVYNSLNCIMSYLRHYQYMMNNLEPHWRNLKKELRYKIMHFMLFSKISSTKPNQYYLK